MNIFYEYAMFSCGDHDCFMFQLHDALVLTSQFFVKFGCHAFVLPDLHLLRDDPQDYVLGFASCGPTDLHFYSCRRDSHCRVDFVCSCRSKRDIAIAVASDGVCPFCFCYVDITHHGVTGVVLLLCHGVSIGRRGGIGQSRLRETKTCRTSLF